MIIFIWVALRLLVYVCTHKNCGPHAVPVVCQRTNKTHTHTHFHKIILAQLSSSLQYTHEHIQPDVDEGEFFFFDSRFVVCFLLSSVRQSVSQFSANASCGEEERCIMWCLGFRWKSHSINRSIRYGDMGLVKSETQIMLLIVSCVCFDWFVLSIDLERIDWEVF